jgi:signal transduction histidine kinase/ActR/RegA family two-component response regulator
VVEDSFHPSLESFLQLVHPDDRQNLIDASLRAVESGAEFHFDHRFIGSDGTTRIMRERARIERRADGSPSRMVGTVQDVTEQCRLAQRLAQADRMEGIGRLAGGVAHDSNNLMTVINGYAEILWESEPPLEATRRQIEEIRKAGARAAELTNQLLTFSRRQVTQPRVIDLNKAVEEVAGMLGPVIGEDVEVVLDLGCDLHQIWMDPTQLNQVLMNLAINGRDAMRHGGTLTIRTTSLVAGDRSQPLVVLEVEDTGEGIEDSVLPHIFEPFFTTKEQGRGTGLGLSMVYGIVEQAGGEITVSSRLGIGTKFILTLPASIQPAAHCFRPLRLPASVNGGAETVLIVEDQVDVLEIASLALRSKGYRVLEASSPADALSICNSYEGPIHLVLTDVVLPGMSGPELAILLKLSRPSTLIIYMSGYAIEAIAERGVIPADVEYVAKPFTVSEIQARVRAVLNRASSGVSAC